MKPRLTRRGFLATATAALGARALPPLAAKLGGKRVLTLVFDRASGTMRAVDRLVR